MKFNEEVFCSLEIEGTHNWPECPFDEVDFLRVPHRHMFHVKAYKTVTHSDRDVEFILLKRKIIQWFYMKYYNAVSNIHQFEHKSCEMLAKELIEKFDLSCCEVNEDGENGAIVTPIQEIIQVDTDPSPYSKKPAWFNQDLYNQWLASLATPYVELPNIVKPSPEIFKTEVTFEQPLDNTEECEVCGSTDPNSGCKSC